MALHYLWLIQLETLFNRCRQIEWQRNSNLEKTRQQYEKRWEDCQYISHMDTRTHTYTFENRVWDAQCSCKLFCQPAQKHSIIRVSPGDSLSRVYVRLLPPKINHPRALFEILSFHFCWHTELVSELPLPSQRFSQIVAIVPCVAFLLASSSMLNTTQSRHFRVWCCWIFENLSLKWLREDDKIIWHSPLPPDWRLATWACAGVP